MRTNRLLITGARGFVGAAVLKHLDDRFECHGVSRAPGLDPNVTWHQADLRDPHACVALIHDVRPSHLIHCAWETTHGTFWEAESNVAWLEAGKALFEAFARTGGQRIVGCGTCAEYGVSPNPLPENAVTLPSSRYGQAKLALLNALTELPVSFAWARIFYPYGEGEGKARFVPSVCRALANEEPAFCSSGVQLRNFVDVRDLGAALAKLATHSLEGPINLGSSDDITIGNAAKLLGEIAGRPDLIRLGALPDRPNEPLVMVPDLTRQTQELHFRPQITLREGLNIAYLEWQ